jgi:hypothetical protein
MEQIIPGSWNGRKGAITQLSPKPNTPEAAAVKHAAISTGAKSVAICVYCGAIVKFIGRSAQRSFCALEQQRADLHLREIKFIYKASGA